MSYSTHSRKKLIEDQNRMALRKVYGFRHKVRNGIVFLGSNTLFYLAGQIGVFNNLKTQNQKYMLLNENYLVTALSLGIDNQLLLAVEGPKLLVINLKSQEKKILPSPDKVSSRIYIAVSFSPDNKNVGAQGGAPDWSFVLWNWEEKRVETVFQPFRMEPNSNIYKFTFCSEDSKELALVGRHFLRFYYYKDEKKFKEYPAHEEERSGKTFHCVCYMRNSSQVFIGSSVGKILVFRNHSLLKIVSIHDVLKNFLKLKECLLASITCILPHKIGFICSCNGQCICMDEIFQIYHVINVSDFSQETRIDQLISNSNEETIVATTKDGRVLIYAFDNCKQDMLSERQFSLIQDYQHLDDVICSDTIMKNSLLVTCSRKNLILNNVFNGQAYQKSKLASVPTCVSLHPLCLNVAIGFNDGWKIYNILHEKLQLVREFDETSESLVIITISFAPSGHLIVSLSGKYINLLDSITFHQITRKEIKEGKAKRFLWRNDYHIIFCTDCGILTEWNVPQLQTKWTYTCKNGSITAIYAFRDDTYIATSNCRIQILRDGNEENSRKVSSIVTTMTASMELLIIGTFQGAILGFSLDLENFLFERRCHLGEIILIGTLENSNTFAAIGTDGIISVWCDSKEEYSNDTSNIEEFLVDIKEQNEMVTIMGEMEEELIESNLKIDQVHEEQKSAFEQNIQEVRQNYRRIKDSLKDTIDELIEEIESIHSQRKRFKEDKEAAIQKEMEDNDEFFKSKLDAEMIKKEKVFIDRKSEVEYYENKIAEKKEEIECLVETFKKEYDHYKENLQNIDNKLHQEFIKQKEISEELQELYEQQNVRKSFDSEEKNLEVILSPELENQRHAYLSEIEKLEKELEDEKIQNITLDKEHSMQFKYYHELQDEFKKIESQVNQAKNDIKRIDSILEEKIHISEDLMNEISYLESRGDLNLSNLEKELEVKTMELQSAEKELQECAEAALDVDKKLEKVTLEEKKLSERLKSTERSLEGNAKEILRAEQLLDRYRKEFISCTSEASTSYSLRWALLRLYEKRVVRKPIKKEEVDVDDTDPVKHFFKRRDHFLSLINVTQNRTHQIQNSFRKTYIKLVQENSDWTAFVDVLRADVRNKENRIKCLEQTLGLKSEEFSKNPQETQRRLQQAVEKFQTLEEEEERQIREKLDLITQQGNEILRLHALLSVEERNKIVRREPPKKLE